MNRDFVPYQEALALKELGFNEPCFGWFRSTLIPSNFTEFFLETEFGMNESPSDWVNSNFLDKACSAPLYQQAFRWFREKYKYLVSPFSTESEEGKVIYYFEIGKVDKFTVDIYSDDKSTYEEAELGCLKKLIEIVKNATKE
jgi:hypothetical protein